MFEIWPTFLIAGLASAVFISVAAFASLDKGKQMGIRGSKAQQRVTRETTRKPIKPSSPPSRTRSITKRRIAASDVSNTQQEVPIKLGNAGDLAKFSQPEVLEHVDRAASNKLIQKKFNTFNNWLKANGAEFPALDFRVYADGVRGVFTSCDIPSEVQIVRVPLACLITDDMARKTSVGQRLDKYSAELSVPNHCQVLVYMLMSRKKGNSFFQPYYDILPSNFDNFPIFWDDEKIAWLEGSSLVNEIAGRLDNMRNDYKTICKALPEFKQFSFDDFLWCRTAVGSRNFSIVVNGKKMTAMVPLADMLNHYRPRQTSWTFDNSLQGFTITTLQTLKSNCQVMDSYGKKCNSKFLLHYGFTIEQNREADGKCQDEVLIHLKLPSGSEDRLHISRLAFVRPVLDIRVSMNHEDAGTQEALRYLRIAVASEKELQQLRANVTNTKALNADNEGRVLQAFAQHMIEKLEMYPTSLVEDERLLKSGELPPFSDHRHALIVIISEKKVASFYIDLAKRFCPLLALPRLSRVHAMRRLANQDDDFGRFASAIQRELENTSARRF